MLDPEIILGIIDKKLNKNMAFNDLLSSEDKANLINKSLIRSVETGEILCQQGQYNDTLFLILDGGIEISARSDEKETILSTLGEGELVGEISSLFMIPRIATATVTQSSVVLEIPGELFSNILSDNPDIKDTFIKRSKKLVIETTLSCAPVFDNLDKQCFSELCYISSNLSVIKDDIICHEGTKEKSMYVIGNGIARSYITIDGKEITNALLRPGDYFGEYPIFTGDSRCASVSALTDMQLVLLEGESFETFIDYNEETDEKMSQRSSKRKESLDLIRGNLDERHEVEFRIHQIQSRLRL